MKTLEEVNAELTARLKEVEEELELCKECLDMANDLWQSKNKIIDRLNGEIFSLKERLNDARKENVLHN